MENRKKNETKGVVASMKRNSENPEYDEKKKKPIENVERMNIRELVENHVNLTSDSLLCAH